jgi:hypothetical protein
VESFLVIEKTMHGTSGASMALLAELSTAKLTLYGLELLERSHPAGIHQSFGNADYTMPMSMPRHGHLVKNQHVVRNQIVRILRETSRLGPAVRYAINSKTRNDPVTEVIEMAVRGYKVETGQDQCKALLIIKTQDSRAQNDRRLYCRGQNGEQVHYVDAMKGETLSTVFRNSDLRYFTPHNGNEARASGAFFEKIRPKNLKLLKPVDGGPSDLLITQNVQG